MNTITRTLARFVVLPIASAAIIGGAALGMAGAANAAPSISSNDHGNFNAPSTYARPATAATPGAQAHRHFHRYGA